MKAKLEQRLADLPGVTLDFWKDSDLLCVFFNGKEFAHFHGQDVLDIRLSPKIIRDENLSREMSSQFHPKRSPNSRWICVEFKDEADVETVVRLVGYACNAL